MYLAMAINGYEFVRKMSMARWETKCKKLKELVLQRQETPELITVRELSKALRIPQSAVLVLVEDIDYILNNGLQIIGFGYSEEKCQGDWTVESN